MATQNDAVNSPSSEIIGTVYGDGSSGGPTSGATGLGSLLPFVYLASTGFQPDMGFFLFLLQQSLAASGNGSSGSHNSLLGGGANVYPGSSGTTGQAALSVARSTTNVSSASGTTSPALGTTSHVTTPTTSSAADSSSLVAGSGGVAAPSTSNPTSANDALGAVGANGATASTPFAYTNTQPLGSSYSPADSTQSGHESSAANTHFSQWGSLLSPQIAAAEAMLTGSTPTSGTPNLAGPTA